jgi:hypothetical protein
MVGSRIGQILLAVVAIIIVLSLILTAVEYPF